ncbi:MAG: type II toxin-antitoxin system death-on-curing family toxin [Sporichthyaceae bacterium]|nr:type II toxin-antitoxin system death-on-curing family toxin [Sporichthyaceae bacterium]
MIYLSEDDLWALADELLGEKLAVRDAGHLVAAVQRPQASVFGADAYPDVWTKAAALLQSVIVGHPLVDGNKRLGWLAAVVFCRLNGVELAPTDVDAAEQLVIAVASGQTSDYAEIAEQLQGLR